MSQRGTTRIGSPAVASSRPPQPLFVPWVHQSVYDAFVRLEIHIGHVYDHHKEVVEQEGREHAPLVKALFPSEPPRAHSVVEPYVCSHAIVELTNDRDNILWLDKTGEYYREEGSVNGVLRFGKVDKDTYN